jgi:hypothetical protein
MNTHAYHTSSSNYKNSNEKKGNPCIAAPKRLYKIYETNRLPGGRELGGNGTAPSRTVHTIIKLFHGTIMNIDTDTIEWGSGTIYTSE